MAAKRKLSGKNAYEIINGKKFKFDCTCKRKSIDCITVEMWDEVSRKLYKRKKK